MSLPVVSAPPSDISSNSAQNEAIPDKHQIELVTRLTCSCFESYQAASASL